MVAETSKIPGQVRGALRSASSTADAEGRSLGQKLAGGLGTALKAGAATAGATASVAIGTALTKGFQRLTAIDDAKGKLAGLGTSTQGTAKIMDSALASVKGTAFGLGDAATIAANAVAAGIKPGQDLTKYLSMTADAASIAGVSLGDMGQILNQVQTGQTAYTDDLNQLADRGIPIYQWLGKEMGVASSEVKGLAADGKVSSEILFKAIQQNIGGAAQASGRTVRGSFDNVLAAMGRLGAAAESPTFARLPGWFGSLTTKIDDATPAVKRIAEQLDSKIFTEWGPRAGKAIDEARDALGRLMQTSIAQDGVTAIQGIFHTLVDTGKDAAPAIGQIASSLAQASGALGVSSWQLFLAAVQAAAQALQLVAPVLNTVAGLMQSNQAAVTALAAGFLLFRTVPALMARVATAVAPVGAGMSTLATTTRTATGELRGLAAVNGTQLRTATGASLVQLGRFGSAIAQVGQSAPAVARMQQSFITAATGADRFGRTAGVAAAAGSGLRAAGAGVAGLFGGPVGLALTGAAIAGTALASAAQDARTKTQALTSSLADLRTNQLTINDTLEKTRGTVSADVFAQYKGQVDALSTSFEAGAKKGSNWYTFLSKTSKEEAGLDRYADAAKRAGDASKNLGLSNEDVARAVTGSRGQWESFAQVMRNSGQAGVDAINGVHDAASGLPDIPGLKQMRDQFLQAQEAARRTTPGFTDLTEAMRTFGDTTSTAADKSNALKAALDALNPARGKQAAMSQQNAVNQQIAQSAQEAADATQGFGRALIAADGSIATTSVNGQDLYKSLDSIVSAYSGVASAGGDLTAANNANQQSFQQLATKYGVSIDEIRTAANSLGYSDVSLIVDLKGGTDTTQQLGAISAALSKIPSGQPKVVEVKSGDVTAQTKQSLVDMGFKLQEIDRNGVKTLQISANDTASGALNAVISKLVETGNTTANPQVVLRDTQFKLTDQNARQQLINLSSQVADPKANLTIQQLIDGKNVSMQQLQELNSQIANPQVRAEVTQALSNIAAVNEALDRAARERTASIRVATTIIDQGGTGAPFKPEIIAEARRGGQADGSVRKYAAGGFTALPDSAVIQKPVPGLVQWAEPETKGEAFIPLASSKRRRSSNILATVADMFGFALLPKDNIPDTLSGQVGGVAGGALSSLIKSVGGGVAKFADGGIRSAKEIRDFVNGAGASRPLTGAPYVWGGVNWGDCSGAMAAIARFAMGLDPFGGRFSTANEGDYLAKLGAKMGAGGPGTLRFGWTNNPGGPGGGHTAGTLPDGTNVEMGGSYGGGMVGGTVGANDSQFANQAYMEVGGGSSSDAGSSVDTSSSGGTGPSGSTVGDSAIGSSYSFDPITSDTANSGGGDTSLSGRVGSVASAFLTGQMQDLFKILSINDQPGWLSAITEYEKQHSADGKKNYDAVKKKLDAEYQDDEKQRSADYDDAKASIDSDFQSNLISAAERDRRQMTLKAQYEQDGIARRHEYENAVIGTGKQYGQVDNDSVASLSLKQRYEDDQLRQTQQLSADQYARDAQYEREKKSLDNLRQSNSISQDEYQRRLADAKAKHDADMRGLKDRYATDQGALKTRFEMGQSQFAPSDQYIPNNAMASRFTPSDPGTNSAGAKGDSMSGGATGTSRKDIKEAFKDGLREAWRFGEAWTDTDWIVNKESTWVPTARNGNHFGLIQATPEVYAAAGKAPDDPDPTDQGQVYDKYVGDKYQTPQNARDHWQKNNWYDQGGEARGIGVMQKNVLRPERVLSPSNTEAFNQMARRNFQGAGNDDVVAAIQQLTEVMAKRPPLMPVVVPDEAGRRRVEQSRVVQRHLVGK